MPESGARWLVLAVVLALAGPAPAVPQAGQGAISAAKAALRRGDGIAGEAALNKALAAGASREQVAARMGEALLDQGELVRAREWLAPVHFAPGEQAHGWRMLAMLERSQGNFAAAAQAYDKALGFAPNDPLLWVDIARLRYQTGDQLQAMEAASRAHAAGPEEPRVLELRAELLRDSAGWNAALPIFEQALEQAPDDLSLLGGYAATLGEAGRAGDMLVVTRKMIGIAPKHPYAWYLQAVLAARGGNMELARRMLARTGTRLRDLPAAIELQGVLELEAGNANLAADLFARLIERQGANQRLQLLYARALYESGDLSELHQRFEPLAARADAPSYLLELLGRAYEEEGNRLAAAALLDRAVAAPAPAIVPIAERTPVGVLAARWGDAQGALANAVPYVRSLLSAGNFAQAQAVSARLRQLHPGSTEAAGLSGDAAMASGQLPAAIGAYALAARVRFPDDLLLRSSEAMARAGRGDQAMVLVTHYRQAFPGSRFAARLAAGHHAFAGDWEAARLLLDTLRLGGGGRDVRLLADLSLAELRSGDTTAALASARRAYRLQPRSGVAAQALGMALAARGSERKAALALLDKARAMGGPNPLLNEARQQLRR